MHALIYLFLFSIWAVQGVERQRRIW